jgi:hypothetical protein
MRPHPMVHVSQLVLTVCVLGRVHCMVLSNISRGPSDSTQFVNMGLSGPLKLTSKIIIIL